MNESLEVGKSLLAIKSDAADLAAENERLGTSLASLRSDGDASRMQAADVEAELVAAKEQVQALVEREKAWQDERTVLAAERDALVAAVQDAGNARQAAEGNLADVERLQTELAAERERADSLGGRITDLEAERSRLLEQIETASADTGGSGTGNVAPSAGASTTSDDRVLALTLQLRASRGRIAELEQKLAEPAPVDAATAGLQDELTRSKDENAELASELDALRNRMQKIETLLVRYTPSPPEPAPR
ncbi:MAG: hypothetical protein R3C97_05405 [Geminicoccaceae bacterium]